MTSNLDQNIDSNHVMTDKTELMSSNDNQMSVPKPIIQNISPRTLTGVLSQSNANAIDWSSNGLIAFGSHNRVVVVDTLQCLRVCQTLHRHNSAVCLIRWCNSSELKLCSADTNGSIIVWDVTEGSVLTLIPGTKDLKSIESIEWFEFNTNPENSLQNYLLVLYRNNCLVLFDSEFGDTVWTKQFDLNVRSISLDPFCKNNILFGIQSNHCCFATVDDLKPNGCPIKPLKQFVINIVNPTNNSVKNNGSVLKYNLSVKTDNKTNEWIVSNDFIQISFHKSVRNQVLVVFSREILLIDLSVEAIICCVPLERNSSHIMNVFSCVNRNAFFVCHDFGTVSLRLLQKQVTTDPNDGSTKVILSYVNLCQSDGLRLIKQNKIFGYSMSPTDETQIALMLNNGRIVIKKVHKIGTKLDNNVISLPFICDIISPEEYRISETKRCKTYRILISQLFSALIYSPHVVRMCPPITMKNWQFHRPLLAVGDSNGTVQIWNLLLSTLEREFCIHSFPVRGLEWTGLESFISFAFPNISPNSGKTNNELNITEVNSGRTYPLRAEKNMDSSPIDSLKISHLKQYLIISFKSDPFEIWDLKSLCLLRVMPKQFSAITAIEWSPLYNKRLDLSNPSTLQLHSKENFVVTNSNGELYHFSIEGNVVKEITCIPPDTEMSANITCIAWKSDQVLLGDAIGNLNVWDLKKKVSKIEPTHRGPIKKIRFGPGRGNMKFLMLFNDGVDVWDIKEFKLNAQLKSPRDMSFKIVDIDWATSDRPVLSTSEGTILVTDMKLKQYTSALSELVDCETEIEEMDLNSYNFHLLSPMSRFIFKSKLTLNQWNGRSKLPESDIERHILVSKLFGDSEGYHFWTIISYLMSELNVKLDRNYDLFLNNNDFKEMVSERVSVLESVRHNYNQNKICYELYLTLRQPQRAVQLLLESDPSVNDYYVDALRACLIASLQSKGDDPSAQPVIKLVATNLIANSMVSEGSQLLCLINKTQDACRYLQSANKWIESIVLAKCTLEGEDYNEVLRRWAEHLISCFEYKTAVIVFISLKQYLKSIHILLKFDVQKAVLFSDVCIKRQLIDVNENKGVFRSIFDEYSKKLENSGLDQQILYYKQLFKILD